MKTLFTVFWSVGTGLLLTSGSPRAEAPPPVYQAPAAAAVPDSSPISAPVPEVSPAPPPSAPPKRSAADLEKLVAPIALYPDPLIATILPASAYPLEIVQAARFVKDTNNLPRLEQQPWDENVKAVARVPAVIQKMNDDLQWTIDLGEAFVAQQQEVMAAIQTLRGKAQQAGTLQTTPQQTVVVTNTVVEKTVEQQVVVVTNTIVQIQPANPQVVYVPQYNPTVVYAPPPAYVYDPLVPLVTFGVGVAVGAVIANNCDWHSGGVYVGPHGAAVWGSGYHGDVDVNVNRNINVNQNVNVNQQKWQPDQNRLRTSGASGTYASANARGWGSGTAQASAASAGTRSAAGTGTARSPAATPSAARPSPSASPSRPASSPNVGQARTSAAARPSGAGESAFSGVSSGAGAREYSSRGAASRAGGYSGGARPGGYGGGGRGGGRR